MAKAQFKMPDDFLDKLSRLENHTDDIIPKVLEAGGEVALEAVRSNLQAVVGHDTKFPSRSTGELQSALGLSPAKMDRNGNFNVKVGFAEPHRDGISNAMIANILEYGKHGQPPKPFLNPARAQSRKAVIDAMKRKMEDEVGKV